jgi:uncharacterized protein
MRIDRDAGAGGPIVTGLSPRGFKVEERVFRALLLTPERADGWSPPPIEALDAAALGDLPRLDPAPEFVLLGTGPTLVRPPLAFTAALEVKGISVEAMDSRAAARAWGVLRGEGRWIAAALYPLA